jgi:hypothetical protein
MQEGFFLGNDAEASRTLVALESLVRDMKAIQAGTGPTSTQIENAPLLDAFQVKPYATFCLAGYTKGHPLLGDSHIHTSQLWAIDPKRHWARTFSRFYRLGDSVRDLREELERRMQARSDQR